MTDVPSPVGLGLRVGWNSAFLVHGQMSWSCGRNLSHSRHKIRSCGGSSGRPSKIDLPAHSYGRPVSGWIEGGRTSCTDPARSSKTTSVFLGSSWTGHDILWVIRSAGALKISLPRFSRPMICGADCMICGEIDAQLREDDLGVFNMIDVYGARSAGPM
jgi:hypothetical protein